DVNRNTSNVLGSFRYNSLEELEQNLPYRFERTLSQREERTGRTNAGLFLSDTWRVSTPLELQLGLRWDYSRYDQRPDYNPDIESAFGLRTDVVPSASAISPRISFSYTPAQAGGRGGNAGGGGGGGGAAAGGGGGG